MSTTQSPAVNWETTKTIATVQKSIAGIKVISAVRRQRGQSRAGPGKQQRNARHLDGEGRTGTACRVSSPTVTRHRFAGICSRSRRRAALWRPR